MAQASWTRSQGWVGTKLGTSRIRRILTQACRITNPLKTKEKNGGRDRDRTGDPLLAKRKLRRLAQPMTVSYRV
jgi:hypothetical protein